MALEDYMDVVQEAARNGMMITMDYESPRDGKYSSQRLCEPYSLRGEFFFAWDVQANHIKKFFTSGVSNVQSTEIPFYPRFPVEF